MLAKPHDPSTPTFYFDTSTICETFESATLGSRSASRHAAALVLPYASPPTRSHSTRATPFHLWQIDHVLRLERVTTAF
jgi:hypothetical protein